MFSLQKTWRWTSVTRHSTAVHASGAALHEEILEYIFWSFTVGLLLLSVVARMYYWNSSGRNFLRECFRFIGAIFYRVFFVLVVSFLFSFVSIGSAVS